MPATLARRSRAELHERLEARLPEIEQTILTRARSLADPEETDDPVYAEGLQAAISAGLRYGLSGIDVPSALVEPIPPELVYQARLAARSGISLETVLRRYFAGYTLLGDFVIQEAKSGAFEPEEFQRLLRTQAELFDRLIVVVSEAYREEAERRLPSTEQRKAQCVERLLASELADASELNYELEGWHLGVVATGADAEQAIRRLAGPFDRRLLIVLREGELVWAWLGGRQAFESEEIGRIASSTWPEHLHVAIGEPAKGLAGWRLSHRQAVAALPLTLKDHQTSLVRYGEVALLASMLRDEVLVSSLRELYLVPLESERDGGETLRRTLRAYFVAECNVSSTAAALKVTRQTVANRLSTAEERIGRPLNVFAMEMSAALQLQGLDATQQILLRGS